MALSGVHVICASVTSGKSNGPLANVIHWAQTASSSGNVGNQIPTSGGPFLIRANGSADFFIASGKTAAEAVTNAGSSGNGTTNRHFAQASLGPYDFYVDAGRYIAWVAA